MKNDRKVRITMNKKDILEIKRRFKKKPVPLRECAAATWTLTVIKSPKSEKLF